LRSWKKRLTITAVVVSNKQQINWEEVVESIEIGNSQRERIHSKFNAFSRQEKKDIFKKHLVIWSQNPIFSIQFSMPLLLFFLGGNELSHEKVMIATQ